MVLISVYLFQDDIGMMLRPRFEKLFEIAQYVAGAAVDLNRVFSVRHVFLDRLLPVQLFAKLIEVDDLQAGPSSDSPLVRNDLTQEDPEEGGLSDSVGTDDAEPVLADNLYGKVSDQDLSAETVADPGRLDHQPAGAQSALW